MFARAEATRRIAILAYPGVQLLDVAGPGDVFAMADKARDTGASGYRVELIAPDRRPLRTSCGLRITPDLAFGDCSPGAFDTILVAGGVGAREAAQGDEIRRWLSAASAQVRRLGAVCTGAWFLAEAGVLEGRRAVTHWASCDRLAAAHPALLVEKDAIFVRDGTVWTSAGVSSGIDLALAMVEEDHGRALALAVARLLVVFLKRPGGQSQFSAPLAAQLAEPSAIRDVQQYAIEHPGADLRTEVLAARAAMSPRNFARVFVRETGTTPGGFVEHVRLDTARRLLEETTLTAEAIARRCGFGEPDTMRRAFLRRLGIAPRDYRARFRSTGAATDWPDAA